MATGKKEYIAPKRTSHKRVPKSPLLRHVTEYPGIALNERGEAVFHDASTRAIEIWKWRELSLPELCERFSELSPHQIVMALKFASDHEDEFGPLLPDDGMDDGLDEDDDTPGRTA